VGLGDRKRDAERVKYRVATGPFALQGTTVVRIR
jgi:hypothetical protein